MYDSSENSEIDYSVHGIRISPPYLEFNELVVGMSFKKTLTFINVTPRPIKVGFKPQLQIKSKFGKELEFEFSKREQLVASGISVVTTITFHCQDPHREFSTYILVEISDHDVYIPIIIQCPQAILDVARYIDFGCKVVDGKVVSTSIIIKNSGLTEGVYSIRYKGSKSLKILHPSGSVLPETIKEVQVEVPAIESGKLREIIEVQLNRDIQLPVYLIGEFVEPKVHVLTKYPNGEAVKRISFGCVYYDSMAVDKVFLYNDSPQQLDFLVILDTLLLNYSKEDSDSKSKHSVAEMFIISPSEGHVPPYSSCTIHLKFSPKLFENPDKGWKCLERASLPIRREMTVSITFECVNSYRIVQQSQKRVSFDCFAIAIPLDVLLIPNRVDFGVIQMKETVETMIEFKNFSQELPVYFETKPAAFTKISPQRSKISLQDSVMLHLQFSPKAPGRISKAITIDVFGKGTTAKKPFELVTMIICTLKLRFIATVSTERDINTAVKFNPGITPMITNEVGFGTEEVPFSSNIKKPQSAMLQSRRTTKHDTATSEDVAKSLIAFPNDRNQTMRPVTRSRTVRTIFTKTARYTYVDQSYQYTAKQLQRVNSARAKPGQKMQEKRILRKKELLREQLEQLPAVDIGMIPQVGLKSHELKLRELEAKEKPKILMSHKELFTKDYFLNQKNKTLETPLLHGVKACPTTNAEKNDCKSKLTPKQIYMIHFAPSILNFHQVCIQSTSTLFFHIMNSLDSYIFIEFQSGHYAIKLSHPLTMVIPPKSHTKIPVDFEPCDIGKYYRPLEYKINGHVNLHAIIIGEVIKPYLLIEPEIVVIEPNITRNVTDGYCGIVTLTNPLNHPIRFQWLYKDDVLDKNIVPFKIQPRIGTLDPSSCLDCEVIYFVDKGNINEMEFILKIFDGKDKKLKCSVMMEMPKVVAVEEIVSLGSIPLNLVTEKIVTLRSLSTCHTVYQVIITNQVTGPIQVEPTSGLISAMGFVHLTINMLPKMPVKIETKVSVLIKNGKAVDFRISAQVESPCILIDNTTYIFKTIHCDLIKCLPITITNKGKTAAEVGYDLKGYSDFSINCESCAQPSAETSPLLTDCSHNQLFTICLKPGETIQSDFCFSPRDPCAYDFTFPIRLNNLINVSECKDDSSKERKKVMIARKTTHSSHRMIESAGSHTLHIGHVIATAITPLMQVHPPTLDFTLHHSDLNKDSATYKSKEIFIENVSSKILMWNVYVKSGMTSSFRIKDNSFSGELKPAEKSSFVVLFYPYVPGKLYVDEICITLKNFPDMLKTIPAQGIWEVPQVEFNPPEIFMPIMPLGIDVQVEFSIVSSDVHSAFEILDVSYPEVNLSGEVFGRSVSSVPDMHLHIIFPRGKVLHRATKSEKSFLPAVLNFKSAVPCSFSGNLVFVTIDGFRFIVPLHGGADNCLLSCFTLIHRWKKLVQIVVTPQSFKSGTSRSEPMPVICHVLSTGSRTGSTESTFDLAVEDEYSTTFDTVSVGRETAGSTLVDSAESSEYVNSSTSECTNPILCQLTPLTEIIERWFSVHGFAVGMFPIKIPDYFLKEMVLGQSQESRNLKQAPIAKLYYNIADCIHFLTGKMINANLRVPASFNVTEKVDQFYKQNEALIAFLKMQSGCIPGVNPEYLLPYEEYSIWFKAKIFNFDFMRTAMKLNAESFQKVSKRAWTLYLLQLYKALILYRINLSMNSVLEIPKPGGGGMEVVSLSAMEPLGSNIYSVSERILLAWLNYIFEMHRNELWKSCSNGIPIKRWIVNFDKDLQDSLVLATVLSAYCPFVASEYLLDMYTCRNPLLYSQMTHNAIRIIKSLELLGLEYDVKPADIVEPHPVGMIMLCVFLFERLPNYLPRNTVTFVGALHASVSKQVVLTNAATRPVSYKVLISGEGADNYTVSHQSINISANGKFTVAVQCRNRYLFPKNAVLQVIPKRVGPNLGTAMIFLLEAKISVAKPKETVIIQCPCYGTRIELLKVRNFFLADAVFTIEIKECSLLDSELSTEASIFSAHDPNQVPFFYCNVKKLRVDASEQKDLEIKFIPLLLRSRQCFIIFSHPHFGEFVYSVIGNVMVPNPMNYILTADKNRTDYFVSNGIIHVNCFVNDVIDLSLPIPYRNKIFEETLLQAVDLHLSELNAMEDPTSENFDSVNIHTILISYMKRMISTLEKEHPTVQFYDVKTFEVRLDNEHFQYPKELKLYDLLSQRSIQLLSTLKDVGQDVNVLSLKIKPEIHGYYTSRIILRSEMDYRVYQIIIRVNSSTAIATIEFETPAQQPVHQDIPIVNTTKTAWDMKTTLEGRGFSGRPILHVPSESTVYYSLCFWPLKEVAVSGHLTFVNEADEMEYHFNLIGIGRHPYPFASVTINCQARETVLQEIEVPNNSLERLTFVVESNLPFFNGPPTLTIPPLCKGHYPLEVYCLFSGEFVGVLSFRVSSETKDIDSDNEEVDQRASVSDLTGYMIWLSVTVITSPAPAEKHLSISSNILECATLDVLIKNPTSETISLGVEFTGEGLKGASVLQIEGNRQEIYTLEYAPSRLKTEEGRLVFFHWEVGEFWYSIQLQALPPLPTYLPDVVCQLGETTYFTLSLKNTCDDEIVILPSHVDNVNFGLKVPEQMLLQPFTEVEVLCSFTPSSIQRIKNKINFSSRQLGDVIYFVQGQGQYPSIEKQVYIYAPITMTNTTTITFLNPTMFDAVCKIEFYEIGYKTETHFSLPVEQFDGILMRGRSEIQIPIIYRAKHMRQNSAKLSILLLRADRKTWNFLDSRKEVTYEVQWNYVIYGIPECIVDKKPRPFKCQAKKSMEDIFHVTLFHCVPPTGSIPVVQQERFTIDLCTSAQDHILTAFVTMEIENHSWDVKSNVAELDIKVFFKPALTLKMSAMIKIRSAAGGVWKFPVQFSATDADPDMTIVIKSDDHVTANTAVIRIKNPFNEPTPYQTNITTKNDGDSKPDFKVEPESGMFSPCAEEEELTLLVTYFPRTYGRISKARVMIQAAQSHWLVELQGIPPHHKLQAIPPRRTRKKSDSVMKSEKT